LLLSLGAVPLGLVVLIGGEVVRSLPLFLLGTGLAGIGIGLGFASTLAALNALAGDDDRTKLLTSYFVITYFAAAVPVVGIGVITELWSPLAADISFACVVGLMALGALVPRWRGYGQSPGRSGQRR
jgi:F0F1-type ATP synthase membrane subunit c/vacuolar-type H+-ATPase subunit K